MSQGFVVVRGSHRSPGKIKTGISSKDELEQMMEGEAEEEAEGKGAEQLEEVAGVLGHRVTHPTPPR